MKAPKQRTGGPRGSVQCGPAVIHDRHWAIVGPSQWTVVLHTDIADPLDAFLAVDCPSSMLICRCIRAEETRGYIGVFY